MRAEPILAIVFIVLFVLFTWFSTSSGWLVPQTSGIAAGFAVLIFVLFVAGETVSSVCMIVSYIIKKVVISKGKKIKVFLIVDGIVKIIFALLGIYFTVLLFLMYYFSAGILAALYTVTLILFGVMSFVYVKDYN